MHQLAHHEQGSRDVVDDAGLSGEITRKVYAIVFAYGGTKGCVRVAPYLERVAGIRGVVRLVTYALA